MIESKTIDGVPIGKGLSHHLTRRRSIEKIKSTGVVDFFTSWSQLIDQSFIWRYESCYAIIGAENSHQLIDEIPRKQGLEKSFQNSQVLRVIIQQEQELWEERMLLAGALFPEESRQMYHMGRGVPRWEAGRCLHTIDHCSGTFYTGAKPHEDVHGSFSH